MLTKRQWNTLFYEQLNQFVNLNLSTYRIIRLYAAACRKKQLTPKEAATDIECIAKDLYAIAQRPDDAA